MRRCAISVPANIAEGNRRYSRNDFLHFLNISESSLEELKYYIILSNNFKYISKIVHDQIYNDLNKLSALICNFKKSIKRTKQK